MRQFVIAAALAVGLMALWATILPLIAEPAAEQAAATSPAMSKALFLCRGQSGLDPACVKALARALALDTDADSAAQVSEQRCEADQTIREESSATRSGRMRHTMNEPCCAISSRHRSVKR